MSAMTATFLSHFDLFGSTMNLQNQKNNFHKTSFGGLMSFAIFGCLIAGLYWYGVEVVKKEQPEILQYQQRVQNPEKVQISPQEFNFAIAIQNRTNNYIPFFDPSYIKTKISWTIMTLETNIKGVPQKMWHTEDLRLEPCSMNHFQNVETKSYFESVESLDQMLCISLDDFLKFQQITIEGDFDSPKWSFIQFTITQCNNDTLLPDEVQCQTQQELDRLMGNNVNFALYYTDQIVDCNEIKLLIFNIQSSFIFSVKDLFNPFKSYGRNSYTQASNRMLKEVLLYLRNYYIKTDTGFLLEDQHTIRAPILNGDITQRMVYRSQNDTTTLFLRFTLRMEKGKQTIIERRYKQLQNLVPEIGGLMKILLVAGWVLCWPISNLDLQIDIINEMVEFADYDIENAQEYENMFQQKIEYEDINNSKIEMNKNYDHIQQNKVNNKEINIGKLLSEVPQYQEQQIDQKLQMKIQINNEELKEVSKEGKVQKDLNQLSESIVANNLENMHKMISAMALQENLPNEQCARLKKIYGTNLTVDQIFQQLMTMSKRLVSLRGFEYFSVIMCPKSKKIAQQQHQIDFCFNNIAKKLEVTHLLRKLREIDQLKLLFLDEDQVQLFQYLPKQTLYKNEIYLNDDQRYFSRQKIDPYNAELDHLSYEQRSELQMAALAYQSLQNIKSQTNLTPVDEKLLKMFDRRFLSFYSANSYKNTQKALSSSVNAGDKQKQKTEEKQTLHKSNITGHQKVFDIQQKYFDVSDCENVAPFQQYNGEDMLNNSRMSRHSDQVFTPASQLYLAREHQ